MDEREKTLKELHDRNRRKNEARAALAKRTADEINAAKREQARIEAEAPIVPWETAAQALRRRAATVARWRGLTITEAAKTSECAPELAALLRGASPTERDA